MHRTGIRRDRFDVVDVRRSMYAGKLCAAGGGRLVLAQQPEQARGDQLVFDGAQPLRALRVVRPHVVKLALRVCDVRRLHACCGLTILGLSWPVC